ncbi:hypothetical protein [Streptomyces sp. NPDC058683]|uniref:hypothetical protein n=1 Tax=Streptomyces sp. NPDC058683 TaxID=3346597 RepID=UPI003659B9AC
MLQLLHDGCLVVEFLPAGGPLGGGDVVDGCVVERDTGAVQERLPEQPVPGSVRAGVALADRRVESDGIRPFLRAGIPDMAPLCVSVKGASY